MSANAANDTIHFPPAHLVDCILHYGSTDFHVHMFVLLHHSAYFRTVFEMLSAQSPSSSSSSSSDDSQPCSHPWIAHCIHLPQLNRLVEGNVVTAADIHLFLCHLYFSSHHCYPPFLPGTDVDLTVASSPLSMHFAPILSLAWSDESPQLRFADGDLVCNESLLTLAHYFDCAQMLQQCEVVLLAQTKFGAEHEEAAWLTSHCLESLQCADRYRLRRWRAECTRVVAADRSISRTAGYKRAKLTWGTALQAEVTAAMAQGTVEQAGVEEQTDSQQLIASPTLPTIGSFEVIGDAVFFPPRQLADFVLHYDDISFHIHRFVLHFHSTFFRTYFETLSRATHDSSPSSKRARRCNHPHIDDCYQMLRQIQLVTKEAVTADDFRLFLCHLYFGAHYCYPPYLPLTDVDLDSDVDPLPVSLSFSPSPISWFVHSTQLRMCDEGREFVMHESLLTLARSFDCAQLLKRCEAVLLSAVEWSESTGNVDWLNGFCWWWLEFSERYRLADVRRAFIRFIASNRGLLDSQQFREAKQARDKGLLLEIMEVAIRVRDGEV